MAPSDIGDTPVDSDRVEPCVRRVPSSGLSRARLPRSGRARVGLQPWTRSDPGFCGGSTFSLSTTQWSSTFFGLFDLWVTISRTQRLKDYAGDDVTFRAQSASRRKMNRGPHRLWRTNVNEPRPAAAHTWNLPEPEYPLTAIRI